ncbi:hypothetical protein GOP47_0003348 [Adiantum capillus-veneris]|uniref:Uncharacterized protein n=1 Tax=Adiantum capillus-veneris TaxID=13818 RepID=A0A9D4ZSG2_ADICA|nr:hypothetical protein GOP47_0003348 [Adiantum capillus-veneris]
MFSFSPSSNDVFDDEEENDEPQRAWENLLPNHWFCDSLFIFTSPSPSSMDISLTVGSDASNFTGDPNGIGELSLGIGSSTTPPSLPDGTTGTIIRPQVLGFFGRKGTNIDSLGLYLSNPII